MTAHPKTADLIVLVAGKNDEAVVGSLLRRPRALGIRDVRFDIEVHPRRDPGCLNEAHNFLRPFAAQYENALVVFDRAGSGREDSEAVELEQTVTGNLANNGWGGRGGAIVIDPELETWLWSPSPHVETGLGWAGRTPSLREWLRTTAQWLDTPKPLDPKRSVEMALREARVSRSSSIYSEIASKVSFENCQDASFGRFKARLKSWFSVTAVTAGP